MDVTRDCLPSFWLLHFLSSPSWFLSLPHLWRVSQLWSTSPHLPHWVCPLLQTTWSTWKVSEPPDPWGQFLSPCESCSVSCFILWKVKEHIRSHFQKLPMKRVAGCHCWQLLTPLIIYCLDPTRVETGFYFSFVNTSEALGQLPNMTGPQLER